MPENRRVAPSTPPSSTGRPPARVMNVPISVLKKAGGELVGTFILVFAAAAGPIVDQKYDGVLTLMGNAACSGLAVMIVVMSIGHISKAHLNPAVTLAFAVHGHFPWAQVPAFVVAQVIGSVSASFLLKAAYNPFVFAAVNVPSVGTWQALVLEFVASLFLMFVITAVATDSTAVGEVAGIAIGGTVLLDILIIGPATGGSMNPVRTLGPALAAGRYHKIWIYMLAPPAGTITGAAIYALIKLDQE